MQVSSIIRHLFLLALVFICVSVFADDGAATVKIVVGSAWTETQTGERFAINEGQQIEPGATLVTENDIIQLMFRDGGFMVVQKHTRFRIEKFSYSGNEDGSEWAVFELIKGGLRAISGAIGHARAKRYGVRTSYGTIGIRGTAYNLLVCETECVFGEHRKHAQGLHAETTEGTIFIENSAGVFDVPSGKSAYVKDSISLPEFTIFSPHFVRHDSPDANRDLDSEEPLKQPAQSAETNRTDRALATDSAGERPKSAGVRILSRPGQPLVVGMKADITMALEQATATINGDILAPIISVDTPAIATRPANERGAPASKYHKPPSRGVAIAPISTLPRVVAHTRASAIRGAATVRSVHRADIAHSAVKAKVILHNVAALAAAKAATTVIPHGIIK